MKQQWDKLGKGVAVLILGWMLVGGLSPAHATIVVRDDFNDGNPATNTGGIGTGMSSFLIYNSDSAMTESGGLLRLAPLSAGGGKGIQARANESFTTTPTVGSTRVTWAIDSIGLGTPTEAFSSSWIDVLAVRTTTESDGHPADQVSPRFGFLVVLSGFAYSPGLYYVNSLNTVSALAQWDWLGASPYASTLTDGATFQLDLTATSYSLTMSDVSIDNLTGSLSGSLATPGPTSAYAWFVHAPVSASGAGTREFLADFLEVQYTQPEPSTAVLFLTGVGVVWRWRRARRC